MLCVTDKPLELIDSMNVSVAKQKNVTHDFSLIVIEGYIAMINRTDKISTSVSRSIVVIFIVFSQGESYLVVGVRGIVLP